MYGLISSKAGLQYRNGDQFITIVAHNKVVDSFAVHGTGD